MCDYSPCDPMPPSLGAIVVSGPGDSGVAVFVSAEAAARLVVDFFYPTCEVAEEKRAACLDRWTERFAGLARPREPGAR